MSAARSPLRIVLECLDRGAVVLALAGAVLVWEAAVDLGQVPSFVLPAPSDIWASIVKHWAALLAHSWVTLLETLAGFGLSLVIGIPLASLIVYSRIFDRVLYPILIASQAVPKVALAPILLVGLGYGVMPKVIVAFLIAFFPVVVTTVTGLASVDRDTLNLLHSMGASKRDVFMKVRFPHAVPSMIAGFGLGYYMLLATGNFDTPLVFACVVFLTLMGIILFYTVGLLDIVLGRWNRTARLAQGAEPASVFGM